MFHPALPRTGPGIYSLVCVCMESMQIELFSQQHDQILV